MLPSRYKHIKGLILIIPTVTIGLWEFFRHELLLPYISMDLGSLLSPILVFGVTILLLRPLFKIMETTQEELNQERTTRAALMEREKIAHELHDGIAQSLFLLSVNVNQLNTQNGEPKEVNIHIVRKTVHQIHEYVRQAIANLRYPPVNDVVPWVESIQNMVCDFKKDIGVTVHVQGILPEESLSLKEKVELNATVREALLNIRKHANAEQVWIYFKEEPQGWVCFIEDDGHGFEGDPFLKENHYGLKIMKERSEKMGWELSIKRDMNKTKVEIRKGDNL